MAHQLEISDGSRAASPPEYEVDDDEDFARTIPSPDLHRPDVTSPPLRSASKNRHDSKSRRSPATSDENLGARTEPSHHEEDTENEDASQDESIDPGESLESFDWDDLETRYHDMVRQKSKEEEALRAEFDALCQYFNVWAQTISDHEVERSFKRYVTSRSRSPFFWNYAALGTDFVRLSIKTQTAFVQKQEHDLEQRRIHCKMSMSSTPSNKPSTSSITERSPGADCVGNGAVHAVQRLRTLFDMIWHDSVSRFCVFTDV
ncbi:hypothetical protein MBLNU459_g4657t1 [Dothideomycetes sp. NU459]